MKYTISILVFSLILLLGLNVSAQKERKSIRKGNKEYYKAFIDSATVDTIVMQNAEIQYRKALAENLESFEAGFNLGNALVKQEKFPEAIGQFELLTERAETKEELGQVYFNMGNAYLGDGKLKEGIEAYKNSLRQNPADTAAKYNLAAALKLLQEQQEQQQQQGDQDQEQQDQDQQDQENKDQEKQDQEGQEEQKSQEQKDEEQKQEQQQAKEDEKEDGEEKQVQQAKEDEMSKENAERILKMREQEEKKVLQKLQDKKSKQKKKRVEKDW